MLYSYVIITFPNCFQVSDVAIRFHIIRKFNSDVFAVDGKVAPKWCSVEMAYPSTILSGVLLHANELRHKANRFAESC